MTGARNGISLSVVIPAHNSSAVIEACVAQLRLRLSDRSAEIIVVENGSTDDTFERCTRLANDWTDPNVQLVILRSDKGMGNALRTGALASRGLYVLLTADDLPFGFDDIDAADRYAADHGGHFPKVLIGSKAHPDSIVNRGPLRGSLTWGFGQLRRWILGMRTGDPQGTILIRGSIAQRLVTATREPGFLFSTELILACERLGIQPLEVPVRISANHRDHESRVTSSDVIQMGLGLLRLRHVHPTAAGSISRGVGDLLRIAAACAVSVFFLAWAFALTSSEALWSSFTSLSLPLLSVALAVCLGEVAIRAIRWRWLLQPTVHTSLSSSFVYICIGHFANALLPFRLGDVTRAYLAGSRFHVSRATVLGTIILERVADGALLSGVLVAGIIAGIAVAGPSYTVLVLILVIFVAAVILGLATRAQLAGRFGRAMPWLAAPMREMRTGFANVRGGRAFVRLTATTAASYGASVIVLSAVLSAAGVSLDWWATALAISAMTLSTAVPAAPGAVGTYEFAGTTALAALGVPAHIALTSVVVVHCLATLPPALIGLVGTLVLHVDVLGFRGRVPAHETTAVMAVDAA